MEQNKHDMMCKAYWDLRGRVRSDPEYAWLSRELEALEPEYEAVLSSLSEEARLTIDRYITLRENRNLRMVEYACEENRSRRADGIASADHVGRQSSSNRSADRRLPLSLREGRRFSRNPSPGGKRWELPYQKFFLTH